MFIKPRPNTIYVKIRKNAFLVRHIESDNDISINTDKPFTSERLLVGNFDLAENLLKKAFKEAYKGPGWLGDKPVIIMHPLEMTEGGLSIVEERVFRELALGAFGRVCKVVIWLGNELSDNEAQNKLQSA